MADDAKHRTIIEKVKRYAGKRLKGHTTHTGEPLANHLHRTSKGCRRIGDAAVCAAWLRYVLSDTETTKDEVIATLGDELPEDALDAAEVLGERPDELWRNRLDRLTSKSRTAVLILGVELMTVRDHARRPEMLTDGMARKLHETHEAIAARLAGRRFGTAEEPVLVLSNREARSPLAGRIRTGEPRLESGEIERERATVRSRAMIAWNLVDDDTWTYDAGLGRTVATRRGDEPRPPRKGRRGSPGK